MFFIFLAYRQPNFLLPRHNYHISIRLFGSHFIGRDGYVIDYGDVKDAARAVCKRLNEHFLCPMYSDVMTITTLQKEGKNHRIQLFCEDGAEFIFPYDDVILLPIVHATTEELAIYCYSEILSLLNTNFLIQRGIHAMAVTCGETPSQEATFRMSIPSTEDPEEIKRLCDARTYVNKGDVVLKPCLKEPPFNIHNTVSLSPNTQRETKSNECCNSCKDEFSRKLQTLVDNMNSGTLNKKETDKAWTVSDLLQEMNINT